MDHRLDDSTDSRPTLKANSCAFVPFDDGDADNDNDYYKRY